MASTKFLRVISPETREANLRRELREAGAERILYVADAFREGLDFDAIQELTGNRPVVPRSDRRHRAQRRKDQGLRFGCIA